MDDKIQAMDKYLHSIYLDCQKDINKQAKAHLTRFSNADKKWQEDVKNGLKTQSEYQRWRLLNMARGERYSTMQKDIAQALNNTNNIATAYINGQLPDVYANNYNALSKSIPPNIDYRFGLVDADTIKVLATSDNGLLPFKVLDNAKDIKYNEQHIKDTVLKGIIKGDTIDTMTKNLVKLTDMNEASARRTVRTSVTATANKGRIDSYKRAEEDGMLIEKQWVATVGSDRTRDWHLELNGQTKPIDEPFHNAYGDIMFPADPNAHPANVYNCRCTLISKIKGFRKKEDAVIDEAFGEIVEEPQIATREQAYKTLTDDIGFGSVEDNVSVIDEKLLAENVTQLKKLNERFGALTTENNGYFSASNGRNAVAYTQGNFRNPNHQAMSLCEDSYGRGYDYLVSKERDFVSKNWAMPCLDKNLPIYTVTHEYGHIFENKVIRSRVDMDVFEKAYKAKMLEKNGAKKAMDFLKKEETKQAKTIWQEITQIAKEENPDFLVSKNISEYGKTNYFEAFAETFANSQCGSPNELGKAMNIWLEREGF